ncbi:3-oxoacyl-ACP synthase III [Desulfococcaceae bacterium HSG7]|nr:3-oxoacyl-ACP synthase III [Desulfococcaceae bacterium HSG7]
MRYSKVYIESFGYELAPYIVTSDDIEKRLEPLYQALHFQKGQLESLTGICERRFWTPEFPIEEGAILAGQKAINASAVPVQDIDTLIYGGVCRENLEPAAACAIAHGLNLNPETQIYDVSNACLGVINGIIQIANAIELKQIRAGLVVSCESARKIVDHTIERMLLNRDMPTFINSIATLTGGSGAVAVLLSDGTYGHRSELKSNSNHRRQLLGGIVRNASQYHGLCRWGPDPKYPDSGHHIMETDSVAVLKNGVNLGIETYKAFIKEMDWNGNKPDKVITHQVGAAHQKTILQSIGVPEKKDFSTFKHLGNIGTVSLPITAAIAQEREFLQPGDAVGFLGIGSGLNCIMLGLQW